MLRHLPDPSSCRALRKSHRLSLVHLLENLVWALMVPTAYGQDNLGTSTNLRLMFACSQNKNQLLLIHKEHLYFCGLQRRSTFTQKGTFKTTCIYSIVCMYIGTNGVYAHKCMSVHVGRYMYTHGTWWPLRTHVTSMMTLAVVRMPRRACSLSWARSQKTHWDCGFRTLKNAEIDARIWWWNV